MSRRSTLRTVVLVVVAFSAARWAAMGFNRIADLRVRRAQSADAEARAPARRAHAGQAWASVRRGRGALHARRRPAQPALPASSVRVALAWVLDLQPRQALHLVAASLARHQPRDRAGRRLPRGDGALERPGLAAARGARARWRPGWRGSTSSTPCPTRASTASKGCGARSSGSASGARCCWPRCCTASPSRRSRCSAGARGSACGTSPGVVVAAAILAYEHQLVRPGDLSRLDAAFFTMNGVMSRDRVRLRAGGPAARERPRDPVIRSSSPSPARPARPTASACSRCSRGSRSRSG